MSKNVVCGDNIARENNIEYLLSLKLHASSHITLCISYQGLSSLITHTDNEGVTFDLFFPPAFQMVTEICQ